MEYIGLLAPVAFVFALGALAQVGQLKKDVDKMKVELAQLNGHTRSE